MARKRKGGGGSGGGGQAAASAAASAAAKVEKDEVVVEEAEAVEEVELTAATIPDAPSENEQSSKVLAADEREKQEEVQETVSAEEEKMDLKSEQPSRDVNVASGDSSVGLSTNVQGTIIADEAPQTDIVAVQEDSAAASHNVLVDVVEAPVATTAVSPEAQTIMDDALPESTASPRRDEGAATADVLVTDKPDHDQAEATISNEPLGVTTDEQLTTAETAPDVGQFSIVRVASSFDTLDMVDPWAQSAPSQTESLTDNPWETEQPPTPTSVLVEADPSAPAVEAEPSTSGAVEAEPSTSVAEAVSSTLLLEDAISAPYEGAPPPPTHSMQEEQETSVPVIPHVEVGLEPTEPAAPAQPSPAPTTTATPMNAAQRARSASTAGPRSRTSTMRPAGEVGPGGALARAFSRLVNAADVSAIIDGQTMTLRTFRDANDALATFNDFSASRYAQLARQFETHTRMLVTMKADLDQIFRRIRTLQTKLARQYPGAFEHVEQPVMDDDDE